MIEILKRVVIPMNVTLSALFVRVGFVGARIVRFGFFILVILLFFAVIMLPRMFLLIPIGIMIDRVGA
jgi:hypothetical protein